MTDETKEAPIGQEQEAQIKALEEERDQLKKELDTLKAELDALKKQKEEEEVDELLASCGFERGAKTGEKFVGISADTYNFLLSSGKSVREELFFAMKKIQDAGNDGDSESKKALTEARKEFLFSSQIGFPAKKSAENPLVANARSRAEKPAFV